MLSIEQIKRNITDSLIAGQELIDEHREEGYSWYENAAEQTHKLARHFDRSAVEVAIILGCSSRSCSVVESFRRACEYLETGATCGFARGYIQSNLERFICYGLLPNSTTSPKVHNFVNNVLNGDSWHNLTLDRHSFSLSIGETIETINNVELIRRVRVAHFQLSEEFDLKISELQSKSWVGWRGHVGRFHVTDRHNFATHHKDVFADFDCYEYCIQR